MKATWRGSNSINCGFMNFIIWDGCLRLVAVMHCRGETVLKEVFFFASKTDTCSKFLWRGFIWASWQPLFILYLKKERVTASVNGPESKLLLIKIFFISSFEAQASAGLLTWKRTHTSSEHNLRLLHLKCVSFLWPLVHTLFWCLCFGGYQL